MNGLVPHSLLISEDVVKSEPGSKLSSDTESSRVLASRIEKKISVVCKLPSLGYSAIAAPIE